MTFPTIPTAAAGRVVTGVQANTTATRTFPNLSGLTKNTGDLLIAIVVAYQTSATANAAFSGWSSGWTEFVDSSSSTTMAIGAAYKWSDGTETGTISVTQASTITGHAAFILLSIPGAHATTPPEGGSRADGTGAAADPASFDPSGWASEDTLWISVAGGGETSTSGAFTGISTTPPTNFGNAAVTSISSDAVGGVNAGVAFRQQAASSQDVGTWSVDTSNARNCALVIAVRPAPTTYQASGTAASTSGSQGGATVVQTTTLYFTPDYDALPDHLPRSQTYTLTSGYGSGSPQSALSTTPGTDSVLESTIAGPVTEPGVLVRFGASPPLASGGQMPDGSVRFSAHASSFMSDYNVRLFGVLWRLSPTGSVTDLVAGGADPAGELPTSGVRRSWSVSIVSPPALSAGERLVGAFYVIDGSGNMVSGGYAALTSGEQHTIEVPGQWTFAGSPAGTTTYLLADASDVAGSGSKKMWTDAPDSGASYVTDTPTAPTAVQVTATAGGTALSWFTPPLAAATLHGVALVTTRAVLSAPGTKNALVARIYRTDNDGSNPVEVGRARSHHFADTEMARTLKVPLWGAISDGQRLMVRLYVTSGYADSTSGSTITTKVETTSPYQYVQWPATLALASATYQVAGTAASTSGSTGAVTRRRLASGSAASTSTTSGNVTRRSRAAAGTSASTSGTSGTVGRRRQAAGTSASTSATSGVVTRRRPLAGTAASTSGSSGAATKQPKQAAGTAASVSASAGTVTKRVRPTGTAASTSGSAGTVTKRARPTGTAASTSGSAGAVTKRVRPTGAAASTSDTAGAVTRRSRAAAGTAASTSATAGTVASRRQAAGTQASTSATAGVVTKRVRPTGTAAATSGTVGSASRVRPVAGTAANTSGTAGAVTVTAGSQTYPVAGTAASASASQGDVTRRSRAAAGTAASASAASGVVTSRRPVAGTQASSSASAGAAARTRPASGAAASTSGTAGAVTVVSGPATHPASGTAASASGSVGAVTGRHPAAGTAASTANTTGAATRAATTHQAAGTAATTAATIGLATKLTHVAGVATNTSATTGYALGNRADVTLRLHGPRSHPLDLHGPRSHPLDLHGPRSHPLDLDGPRGHHLNPGGPTGRTQPALTGPRS